MSRLEVLLRPQELLVSLDELVLRLGELLPSLLLRLDELLPRMAQLPSRLPGVCRPLCVGCLPVMWGVVELPSTLCRLTCSPFILTFFGRFAAGACVFMAFLITGYL